MRSVVVVSIFGLLAPSIAAAERPSVVAVFEIANDTELDVASKLTDYLRVKLAEGGRHRVVDKGEQAVQLATLLREQKTASYKACVDEACQIPLGKELAADKILRGRLTRFGKTVILSVEMVDVATGASSGGATAKCAGTEEALVGAVDEVVGKLAPRRAPPPPVAVPPPPPPAHPRSWTRTLKDVVKMTGSRTWFECEPNGTREAVVVAKPGSYAPQSSICAAAVHAGIITREKGGRVLFETSYDFTFQFVRDDALEAQWNTTLRPFRGRNGHRVRVKCQRTVGSFGRVFGSGPYTDDSSVCAAAVHAGKLTKAGGTVLVEIAPGRPSYDGSSRNGVTTSSLARHPGSFRFP